MSNNNTPIPNEGIEDKPEIEKYDAHRILWVLLKYAITIAVGVGIFFLVLVLRDFFTTHLSQANYYRYLADAFTIPGMMYLCLAVLVFVSKKGAFTGLVYALRHVGRMLLPFIIRKDLTYAEYLELRDQRQGFNVILCFFLVGIAFLIGAAVCIIIFYQYYGK